MLVEPFFKNLKIILKDKDQLVKHYKSPNYNYIFNLKNGNFIRWGTKFDDDPILAPFPELLDFEVTTKCTGPGGHICNFCYKSNTQNGEYTDFLTAKNIIDKLKWVTQIAFGVDAKCETNPDIFKIMEYCRELNIIPNVTVADISSVTAKQLSQLCGAVAVSRYNDKNICYNSIERLTNNGLKQVNMHILTCQETLHWIYETLDDLKTDKRLIGLNCIVLLALKHKGRGKNNNFTQLDQNDFDKLMNTFHDQKLNIGMDSCSGEKYLQWCQTKDEATQKQAQLVCEKCESGLFSAYINHKGYYFPCSFMEGEANWEVGLDVLSCNNFKEDIWDSIHNQAWRYNLLNNNRSCPHYNI